MRIVHQVHVKVLRNFNIDRAWSEITKISWSTAMVNDFNGSRDQVWTGLVHRLWTIGNVTYLVLTWFWCGTSGTLTPLSKLGKAL